MSKFLIKIINNRRKYTTEYKIYDDSLDDNVVNALLKGIRTYADHGHTRFPYNDSSLTIQIVEDKS